jgi:mannosyltransferase
LKALDTDVAGAGYQTRTVTETDSTTSAPATPSRDWLWLVVILGLATALRVFKLDAGLWFDEVNTLVQFVPVSTGELLTTYPSLNHHVLFTLEAKGTVELFGESAWALRLPALLFGIASIWALWVVARQTLSVWETRLAVVLLAVSYHHVWFSQNARGYTGLLFFGLVTTFLLIRASRGGSWKLWTAYGLLSALAIYTHLTAALFVASQALVYLGLVARDRLAAKRARGWELGSFGASSRLLLPVYGFALTGLLALLLYVPLIPEVIDSFTEVTGTRSAEDAAAVEEWKSPVWMLEEAVRSFGPLAALALPVGLVVAVGMASLRKSAPILPAIFLVHLALTLVVLAIGSLRVWPRYFFVDIGFISIFLVHGTFVLSRAASGLLRRRANRSVDARALAIACTALGICGSLVLLPRNYLHPKQDFVGARNFVEANRATGSAVATLGLARMPFRDYYAPRWRPIGSLEGLRKLRRAHGEVWVVYAYPGVTERRYPEIVGDVSAGFEMVRRFKGTLGGGDVLVFRSKGQS